MPFFNTQASTAFISDAKVIISGVIDSCFIDATENFTVLTYSETYVLTPKNPPPRPNVNWVLSETIENPISSDFGVGDSGKVFNLGSAIRLDRTVFDIGNMFIETVFSTFEHINYYHLVYVIDLISGNIFDSYEYKNFNEILYSFIDFVVGLFLGVDQVVDIIVLDGVYASGYPSITSNNHIDFRKCLVQKVNMSLFTFGTSFETVDYNNVLSDSVSTTV